MSVFKPASFAHRSKTLTIRILSERSTDLKAVLFEPTTLIFNPRLPSNLADPLAGWVPRTRRRPAPSEDLGRRMVKSHPVDRSD